MVHALLALSLAGGALTVQGAESTPAPTPGRATTPGAPERPLDPISTLPVYEQRRYRMDLQDCDKQKAKDRLVCRRVVHRQAVTKARRRADALKHH